MYEIIVEEEEKYSVALIGKYQFEDSFEFEV